MVSEHIQQRHESTPQQLFAELTALAASQPKIGELEPGTPTIHTQYRGNFFRRFNELKAVREEVATDAQVFYVRMVKERFGLDLLAFYAEQEPLCDAICEVVEAKDPYDRLVSGHQVLLEFEETSQLPRGSANELNAAVGHSLGVEAIGIYYWERINPLLVEAYTLLDVRTLNAPFLTIATPKQNLLKRITKRA